MTDWNRYGPEYKAMWIAEKAERMRLEELLAEDARIIKRASDPDTVALLYGLPRNVHGMPKVR